MAERPTRTLAVLILTAALAGCAATHVGDDWQCPLAQGEVCTSIAAADPAVVPDAAPPPLATRTPLYRAPETEAATPEAELGTEIGATAEPGTEPRPCAEGYNPFAWLGRLLAPRAATAEPAPIDEAVSTTPLKETPAPAAIAAPHETPCDAGQPDAAPGNTEDVAEPIDGAGTPCPIRAEAREPATLAPIAAAAPIDASATTVIPCGADDAPAAPAESLGETAGTTDAPAAEDIEAPCVDSASAEDAEGNVAAAEDTPPPPADRAPSSSDALVPPPAPDALRTGEVVGRIWIAPFVDAGGVYREGAWVRAVLAPAGWRR